MVAREGDSYSLVESFVFHLPFVGPGYEGKHPLLVSFPSNVPSLIVEDSLPKSEQENLSYPLYAPIYPNLVATPKLS